MELLNSGPQFSFKKEEVLFGNRRFIMVEQINCKCHNKLVDKLEKERLLKKFLEATEKIQEKRQPVASWVVVSSRGQKVLDDAIDEYYNSNIKRKKR